MNHLISQQLSKYEIGIGEAHSSFCSWDVLELWHAGPINEDPSLGVIGEPQIAFEISSVFATEVQCKGSEAPVKSSGSLAIWNRFSSILSEGHVAKSEYDLTKIDLQKKYSTFSAPTKTVTILDLTKLLHQLWTTTRTRDDTTVCSWCWTWKICLATQGGFRSHEIWRGAFPEFRNYLKAPLEKPQNPGKEMAMRLARQFIEAMCFWRHHAACLEQCVGYRGKHEVGNAVTRLFYQHHHFLPSLEVNHGLLALSNNSSPPQSNKVQIWLSRDWEKKNGQNRTNRLTFDHSPKYARIIREEYLGHRGQDNDGFIEEQSLKTSLHEQSPVLWLFKDSKTETPKISRQRSKLVSLKVVCPRDS